MEKPLIDYQATGIKLEVDSDGTPYLVILTPEAWLGVSVPEKALRELAAHIARRFPGSPSHGPRH